MSALQKKKYTQKKRGTLSPSLEPLRSSTTDSSQLQRVKPTPVGGSAVALLWEDFEVSKFQRFQCISNFAFFYSMVCIIKLCGLIHRHPVLVTIKKMLLFQNRLQK